MQAVQRTGLHCVVIGGGVAANSHLRNSLQSACEKANVTLHLTPMCYCTDNAAMIAALGSNLLKADQCETLALEARASA